MLNMQRAYCNQEFCKEVLQKFVNINSCQPEGNEGDMVNAILQLFPDDVPCTVIEHGKNRKSLIIKIQGEQDSGGVALVGHLDTVPFGDAGCWKYHPLSAVETEGQIYGRGTVDMKSGDTILVAVALSLFQMRKKPKESLYFCFTADEENGGLGAIALSKMEFIKEVNEIFIAEPSNEAIGVVEKGALWVRIKTKGILAHSSRPAKGVNAIEKTLEFLTRLRAYLETDREDPYLGRTTVAVTKFVGGISTNVIPDSAEMEVDIRTLTDINHDAAIHYIEALAEDMKRENQGLSIEAEVLNNRPAIGTREDGAFVKRIEKIYSELDIKVKKKGIFFYTDASQIIPGSEKPFAIIGPGDDAKAHQIDECVALDSVVRMAQFYKKYLMDYYYDLEEKTWGK